MQQEEVKEIKYEKIPWYLSVWTILTLSLLWILIIPVILAVILAIKHHLILRKNSRYVDENLGPDSKFASIQQVDGLIESKNDELLEIQARLKNKEEIFEKDKEVHNLNMRKEKDLLIQAAESEKNRVIEAAKIEAKKIVDESAGDVKDVLENIQKYQSELEELEKQNEKSEKQLNRTLNIGKKMKTEVMGIKNLIEKFPEAIDFEKIEKDIDVLEASIEKEGLFHNLVELDCHYKNSKALRKDMNANKKELSKLLDTYQGRYTTKANQTIYQLMVIGLQAELQNILYTLSYSKLEEATDQAEALIQKYVVICAKGNASILSTITRFLNELEPIFIQAITIEYHFYIQREREKEEQRAIREQMRQDTADRKELEKERKKIEQEEEKFMVEMNRNRELLLTEKDSEKVRSLEDRIRELEEQYNSLEEQKEEIVKRSHGRAGYVYVISNLGSFGKEMYKIGMTRRMNPMDRVDELGGASVPFKFDIHAMIFSDNAVDLEQKLHRIMHNERVNKVNMRKEFFETDIFHLQEVVEEIDPTVEFKTTLVAQEYYRGLRVKKEELVEIA